MRIVFANRYFLPDQSATSRMVSSLTSALAHQGFDVTAIASRTLHDHSNVALPAEEMIAGVRIKRLWATRFGRHHLIGRMMDYLTFHISSFLWCFRNLRAGDLFVVCTDPPLLSVTTALPVRWRKARTINWVMDLFPEVAIELEMLSKTGIPGKLSRALRNWSLRKSTVIVCPTAIMASYLLESGFSRDRIRVMHHWSDGNEIRPVPRSTNDLRRHWGLQNKFVIGYSGNFGRAHDFATLLEAAALLRDDNDIHFLLIGGGQQRAHVEEVVQTQQLKNITFKPLQPPENISESLSAADAHIVSLVPRLEHCIVPSKFYGILAAGRPTLFVGSPEGEVASVIASTRCGEAVEIGESQNLADIIVQLKNSPERCASMGRNARDVLDTVYSRDNAVQSWVDLMSGLQQRASDPLQSSIYRSA
ncbi:glycosyltransferase family 4 protein [Phyllobacterium sp. OV277]|uniref:glycosyltransferase family 4 protein n=1 Tax=Phyllobacterium sp. OV277 TaxID=1882772 RepID=UPI00088CC18F|nr:glycosyltransferase family 4 protein [Phyllobacterium sp. OV277]SDP38361.1 Glycosyltransferase involved in cell wall bisynthesis [Phyllobacterium sp. OV277]